MMTMTKRTFTMMHLYPFALSEGNPAPGLTWSERARLGVPPAVECEVFYHPSEPTLCFPFTRDGQEYQGFIVR
jgi:hypothetical protein